MMKRMAEAEKNKAPLIISEFGGCYESNACVREITQVMDQCEENNCGGWAYYQFKQFEKPRY